MFMGTNAQTTADIYSNDPKERHAYWRTEIDQAVKRMKPYWDRADKVVAAYIDSESNKMASDTEVKIGGRYNLFWANVETLRPSLFNRTPNPYVCRRFYEKDPVARLASTVLERNLKNQIELYNFEEVISSAVKDFLVPGMAQAWVDYIPQFGEPIDAAADDESTKDDADADTEGYAEDTAEGSEGAEEEVPDELRHVVGERVQARFIHFKDYLEGFGRKWSEVPWVAHREYLDKREMARRFGKEAADAASYNALGYKPDMPERDKKADQAAPTCDLKCCVWEIWCKRTKQALFLADGVTDRLVEEKDDPLQLEGFFPCPEPLMATTSNDSRIPTPDFNMYQHQLSELDNITKRIAVLTKALKLVGVYDKSTANLDRVLKGKDNTMIGVDKWAMFGQKGGIKGVVQFFPIQEVAEVLKNLYTMRDKIKADIGELTGISDVIRGQTDPNETLGAQELKSNYSGMRMSDRKRQVARFVRDIIRISAGIIVSKFEPERLWKGCGGQFIPEAVTAGVDPMTGQPVPQPSPTYQAAIQLLQNDTERQFRIDIEADSTVAADKAQDQQEATQFVTAVSNFLTSAGPIVQTAPEMKPLIGKLLMFATRRFHVGATMESEMEAIIEQAAQPQPQPQGPDPKIEAEKAKVQAQMQLEKEKNMGALQVEREKNAGQLQLQQAKTQADIAHTATKMQLDHEAKKAEMVMDAVATQQQQQLDQANADRLMQMKAQQAPPGGQ